jgi:GTP cyclohydrolase IA
LSFVARGRFAGTRVGKEFSSGANVERIWFEFSVGAEAFLRQAGPDPLKGRVQMSETTEITIPETTGPGSIADLVRKMLVQLGEDPNREGLRRTPERYEKALRFLTSGYRQDPEKLLNGAMFSVCYDEMVVVRDIELYSLCEHHLLPFFGKCHVAYIPNKKVVGLSKIARLVNMFARRLQIQERLTSQIANAIQDKLSPQGVGVIVEARHLCMVMRGVEKQHSTATTSAMLGVFRENKQTRDEFLALVHGNKA